MLEIPVMVPVGARAEVGKRPDREDQAGQRPRHDRPAHPFRELSEVIRRRHVAKQAARGDVEPGVAGQAQVSDDVIRMQVDGEAAQEDDTPTRNCGVVSQAGVYRVAGARWKIHMPCM